MARPAAQSSASKPRRGPGEAGKLYLAAYNFLQCAGWGYILFCTLQYLMHKRTFKGLWPVVACPTEIFQTLALLEVVHCLVGLVSSNAFLTLIQILSRLMVVWGILVPVPECQDQFGIVMLLVAWCLAEITRYAFYGTTLYNSCPYLLSWCRYSFFLVLYPTGVSGEIVTMVAALPYIRKRGLFTYPLPNHLNFSFDYYIFVILVIGSYLPFFPQLFGHLLKQRKRFLSPSDDSKRK
ncbi:3-hydroxyacyl-CoA dehydratase 1 [Rhipicephalus microplus]|uniref:3-hydroxyacyl-CoA dehydratase 1 n=1 Tax=Rhipicephalus microplus TaxID=6941 RepID=UPI003F6D6F3F